MSPTALREGCTDPRLRGRAFPVLAWLWLEGKLDPVRWQPIKAEVIAHAQQCDPSTAWRTLQDLMRAGYVERHPNDRWLYRLCWTPLALTQAQVESRDGEAHRAA